MSSKQLDTTNIVNELKGSSLFFQEGKNAISEEEVKDASTAPVVPSPALLQSKPTKHTALPLPPSQEPSQGPTGSSTPEALPKTDHASASVQPPSEPTRDSEEQLNMQANTNASSAASANASMLARHPDSLIEEIRKTVKTTGKEVSFVRLTPEEKNLLVDIVYTYKRQGVKTSENEINRIAVNYLLLDYQVNGEASILTRVIDALLA